MLLVRDIDKNISLCYLKINTVMVALTNEKIVRNPRNVLINPDILREARIGALRARKTVGEWLEEAINEKLKREQKKVK